MDQELKLTRMNDIPLPETWSDKAAREAYLLLRGAAGIQTAANESLFEHPLETALQLGIGLGLSYLSRGKNCLGRVSRVGGTCAGLAFTNDVLRHGEALAGALADNWESSLNWDGNVLTMEKSLGRFAFDAALFASAGAAFEIARTRMVLPPGSAALAIESATAAESGLSGLAGKSADGTIALRPGSRFLRITERGTIDKIIEFYGKGERNPPLVGDGPKEVSDYLGLRLPAMTLEQEALAASKILEIRPDHRGSMQHEKYSVLLLMPDGITTKGIVRAFPHGWAYTNRFRLEQASYHLNKAFEFDNGFPVTAARTYAKDGKLYRGWVQEEIGVTLESGLQKLATERFGKPSYENIGRLTKTDPKIGLQLEQAFLERLIHGDSDPHSKNMILLGGERVQNIDFDCAFHNNYAPQAMTSPAYGVNHMFFERFRERQLSDYSLGKLENFLRRYDNPNGIAKLQDLGFKKAELIPMMARIRWFVREKAFPDFRSLEGL